MNEEKFYSLIEELFQDSIGMVDWFSHYLDQEFIKNPEDRVYMTEKLCSSMLYLYFLEKFLPKTISAGGKFLEGIINKFFNFDESVQEMNKDLNFIPKLATQLNTPELKESSVYKTLNLHIYFNRDSIDFKFHNIEIYKSILLRNAFDYYYFQDISRLLNKIVPSSNLIEKVNRYDLGHFLPYIRLIRSVFANSITENIEEVFSLTIILPTIVEFLAKLIFQTFQKVEIISSTPISFSNTFEKIYIWFRLKKPRPEIKEEIKRFAERAAKIIKKTREISKP